MPTWDEIARGLEHYLTLLVREAHVREELEGSRADFFVDPSASNTPGAELRHLEWFLLERPSSSLGIVPAVALREAWMESFPGASAELATSLLQSLPGAFEVTSAIAGEGLWVRDLFTQGELPVSEVSAARGIEVGDLLVGRLYPGDGGVHVASPAVAVFRSPALLEAIRTDLAGMRRARRGVLRIQQLELERLFHEVVRVAAPAPSPAEVRGTARRGLLALGLPGARVAALLRRVEGAAQTGDGGVVTELLSGLAFDTHVDLAAARLILVELWDAERRAHPAATGPADAEMPTEEEADAAAALEAFDRGRAQGKDLEALFRDLERSLGLEEDDPSDEMDEEDAGAPDFPGVVGALVDEFLWDIEREQGPAKAAALASLRVLGEYGRDIGVFEELGRARLLDFSARWLLDESGLGDPAAVDGVLAALQAFCAWSEERHQHPLLRDFEPTLRSLRDSVPRLAGLRRHVPGARTGRMYRVVEVHRGKLRARDEEGEDVSIEVTADQESSLRPGDLVQLSGKPARLGRAYPAELEGLLA